MHIPRHTSTALLLCDTLDLVSHGNVYVNSFNNTSKFELNVSDLVYIKDTIDLLEETYDKGIIDALEKIGTLIQEDNPSFSTLINAIVSSQKIKGTYTDTLGVEKDLLGATVNDLPLGKAAWVDGNYIIGNGSIISDTYSKGYNDAKTKLVKTISGSIHFGEPDDSGDIATYITLPVYGYKTLIVTSSNYASGHRYINVSYSGGTKSVGQNGTMTIDVSNDTVVTISNSGSDYIVDGSYQLIP